MSPTTYYRFQRLYAAPTVEQEYNAMEADLIQKYSRSDGVILSGDCRMDSPGFSAVKGTYSLMDHDSISMKHGDKRQVSKNATCANLENYFGGQYLFQVNLKSTLLETHLFKKVLGGLLDQGVPVKEVITDAHPQIISVMSK